MKFSDYVKSKLENVGGGLPSQAPNYANSTQPFSGHNSLEIGQAHIVMVGNALQIDTENNSMRLPLSPQQVTQFQQEFGQPGAPTNKPQPTPTAPHSA